ncbi:MAG: amino acid ABC transporter permease [Desulfobacula sp.]|jgi:general L-amino acid transport system permease protein|uniref:amino acid ABC transporter permease n=1 Tax=Desulfobacula sp. TaxID=2593537 RepID=UPI001DE1545A|nr:amino acid ABC transporter permease [Desulfobacula sp.]MBT3484114.1 amino acid ABC transporter permease [Desulfobacula sp.]MBT3803773.1 amino acid ABC transporter permease [Desulfobacula sp.]MBT4024478.1 amino acid ABC transporter permease [Desulfobacula sp.]MBT4198519.1 amino acid ABC transporter permease [Desulfobacula sp.]
MNKAINKKNSEHISFWYDPDKRSLLYQIGAAFLFAFVAWYLISNTMTNLQRQSIATGFGFLNNEAAFEIGESLIEYSAADRYMKALYVGFLNTLLVSFIGVILTVILGTLIGIARLSKNWLINKCAAGYIELFQDIPVLLQLFFWYAFFYEMLPSPREALSPFNGLFLCNRGLIFGIPQTHPAYKYMAIAIIIAIVLIIIIRKWAKKRQDLTGKTFPFLLTSISLFLGFPFLSWIIGGMPTDMDIPVLKGFNFKGGLSISPEFAALLLGLVLYTAAFVAEVVRAGIQSVYKGQTEAAMAIGLKPGQVLNLIILPQALRVIIPPLTSQMLNLTKNSSLAVAIGYPDFVSVAGTAINQTGQAIEGVMLIMIVYLIFSLSTSAFMNWYNKKMAIVER